ncbi:hypothetical protein [Shewanella xiamenensis]|uniref:hypothetical protein n=2 Tax=Shewanella xiamenensis TaxID=332186 RepID=UPI0035BA533B
MRANMNVKGILSFVGITGFISILLVVHFYPTIPRSFLGWVALFFLGIPAWVILEFTGEFVLDASFFKRMPSGLRIIVGVPVVLVLMVLALFVLGFVHKVISSVGG